MTGVLTEATGRQDILLRRGATTEWAVLWQRSADGTTYVPVDLSAWTCQLQLRGALGEVWLTKPLIGGLNGMTVARLDPSDFEAPAWAARTGGTWTMTATDPAGRVERLGEGYFTVEA